MSAAPLLEVFRNGESIKSVSIDNEVSVGRAEGCVIRLDDRAVSRQHALFRNAPKGVEVIGRSEFSPLRINGVEQSSAILKSGDVIEIGSYQLKLKSHEPSTAHHPVLFPEQTSEVESTFQLKPVSEPVPVEDSASIDIPVTQPEPDFPTSTLSAGVPEVAMDSVVTTSSDTESTKVFTSVDVLVRLKIPEGLAQVSELELIKEETFIGRDSECDIILGNEKKASRKHAVIRKKGLNFLLQDLGTANGTLLNGRKVEESALADGDIIQIGDAKIEFKATSDEVVPKHSFVRDDEETRFMESAKSMFLNVATSPVQDVGVLSSLPPMNEDFESSSEEMISEEPKSLLQKLKDPKQRKKIIIGVCGVILALTLIFENEEEPGTASKSTVVQKQTAPNAIDKLQVTKKGLEKLTSEQVSFVQARYQAAMKHYQNNDFDQSLYELNKIFELSPEYEPARELQKYVLEGKRRMQVVGDEKKRKEDEERVKEKIALIIVNIEGLIKQKEYDVAKSLFPDLLSLDPNSDKIRGWESLIQSELDKIKKDDEAKRVAKVMNERVWSAYRSAQAYQKSGQCLTAIQLFQEVLELQATDKRPFTMARNGIRSCKNWIKNKREPLLAKAKELENAGDLAGSYRIFAQVNKIDPGNVFAVAGMSRVRDILHNRAKVLFSEGLVAETFSDFDGAFKKYEETLSIAPEEDEYYGRALRKLKRYQRQRTYAEHLLSETPGRAPGSVQLPEGSVESPDPNPITPPSTP